MTEKPRETQAESHVVELKEKVNNSSLMKHPKPGSSRRPSPNTPTRSTPSWPKKGLPSSIRNVPPATPSEARKRAASLLSTKSEQTDIASTCGPRRPATPIMPTATSTTGDFSNFQKTNGYASVPLDGIWLRGPYLHNGSVPSLTDLLEPVENRPKLFYRGYDVYDKERVGFVSSGEDAERFGFRYDVVVPGNGNQGHEYGTGLDPELKKALVEYLKTL